MSVKVTAPAASDPGAPYSPYDAVLSGPYSNAFRQADDDTLFTQGTDPLRPFLVLNFGALTQDGGVDTPTLGSLSLWTLEPPE